MKPTIRRAALLATAAVVLAAALATAPAGGGDREPGGDGDRVSRAPVVKKRTIAPGVVFTRIIQRGIPRRTFILRVDVSKAATIDVALATDQLPSRRTVREISNAHDALAAVNGDFTNPSIGRPTHPFAQDGDLLQTAVQNGPLFGLSLDETTVFMGHPQLLVTIADRDTGQSWRLDRWNQGPPLPGELVGNSPLGGSLEAPRAFACSVRLLPDGEITFDEDRTGVVSDFVVDATGCSESPMERNGGVVISAAPATDEATQLLAMSPGARIRLRWSLGWDGVYDVLGGMPILVADGRAVAETCSSSFCRRNPRTGIGWTDNGRILLVVIDGRRPRWSVGASLGEFANIMRDLGAVQALNLDGGGSTTMVVEGDVVNKPSDGHLRSISNAVLVLPGPDPGES